MDPIEAGAKHVQATGLFETTMLTAQLPNAEALNAKLLQTVLDRMGGDAGVEHSNVRGWQSAPDMLSGRWGGESAVQVAQFALGACNRYSTDLKPADTPRFEWTADMWANVNREGASNNWHVHPQAFWSAVYYVADGYASADDPALGGEIVFQDPRFPMNRMFSSELVPLASSGRPQHWFSSVRPRAGMLIAFPSWLFHKVQPYRGEGTRVSLALNMTVMPARRGASGLGADSWR
ncbi:MAG: TIGR02466 family protein [Pseudomonadota bacterium]